MSGVGLTYETVDINNRGEIVGFYNDDAGDHHDWVPAHQEGTVQQPIEVPDSQVTGPFKINDRRQVVGIYLDPRRQVARLLVGRRRVHHHRRPRRRRHVVSRRQQPRADGRLLHRRRWRLPRLPARQARCRQHSAPGARRRPDGGRNGTRSINDHGQIVGGAIDAQGGSRGFLLERGVFTMFDGTPGAAYTRALDINNQGEIVGDYGTRPVREGTSVMRAAALAVAAVAVLAAAPAVSEAAKKPPAPTRRPRHQRELPAGQGRFSSRSTTSPAPR